MTHYSYRIDGEIWSVSEHDEDGGRDLIATFENGRYALMFIDELFRVSPGAVLFDQYGTAVRGPFSVLLSTS